MEKILHLYKYVDGVNDSPFPSKEQQATLYEFKYDAKRMGNAPTITGTLMHPLCLDELWGNNEVYVSYNGERYFIKQTPTSSYSNDDTRYKHECDFVSERVLLNDVYFYDVVTSDVSNDKPVSNSSNVVFYGDIHELAKRLNYSLQYAKLEYSVVVDEGITSESKLVSFQKQFFANVLQEGYKLFEIPYYFEGKVIHFGYTNNTIDKLFSYGAKDALLSISKNNITQRIINRITGVGSSDNIPYYYPNFDPKGVSEVLYNGKANDLVSVENLIKYKKVKLGDTFIYNYESDKVIEYVDKSKYVVSKDITLLSENYETTKRYELVLDFPFSVDIAPNSSIIELDYSKSFLTNFKARLYRNLELRDTFTSFGEIPYYRLIEGEYNFSISLEFTFGEFDEKTELTESDIPSIVDALTISITSDVYGFEQWTLNTANNIVKLNDYGLKLNTSPKNGDKITFKQLSYIPPQPNLMPPVYRETLGAERFYNALNNTYYDRIMGSYYSFDNLFMVGKNKEDDVLFEDIKPSIKGVTNSYYERIDVFSEFAWDENDNDEFDEEGNYLHPYFFGKLRLFDGEFGFNLFDHAIEEDEMVISMTSGSCGGCNFIIGVDNESQKNIVQVDENGNLKRDANGNVLYGSPQERQNDTSKYEVWVALKKDIETFGVIMPNATNNYRPNAGDTFVILHIDLPNAYILATEERLREELIKYMKENNSEKFNFSLSFSRIFFADNPTILAQLNENARIKIAYNNNAYTLYVSSYSYSMNAEDALPEIRVELSEELAIVKESIVKQLANASLYLNKEVQRVNTSVATTNTTISKNTATAQASITKTNARVENVEKVVMNLQSNSGSGGSQGGINEEQLENYLTTNQYAKKSDIPSLDAYAKSDDVANTYATKSALKGISDSVGTLREDFDNLNDVLNGNVGGVIDTWNEVVAFLDGYSQSDDLAAILSGMNEDISNRVLTTDFEKANDSIKDLLSYFDAAGNANNALKLGGHSADYFATANAVNTLTTDLNSLASRVSINEQGITTNKTNIATLTTDLGKLTGRVDKLEGYWYIDADGSLHTTHNIVVDGGGAFGKGSGGGGDVPSASVSIKFEGSDVLYNPTNGVITLPAYPSAGGGVADSVAWSNITGKPNFATVATSGKYSDLSGTPTIPTSLKSPYALTFGSKTYDGSAAKTITASDLGALTAHQSIYALTINNSAGTAQVTYTPNSKAASLTLTKAMVGLSNVENTALSTWVGSAKITTLGTITSGTWNGTKIANSYLANSSMTIAGTSVSLGGSITAATLKTNLGLGSLAYKSSLVASDIPSLDWSKITSGKPTTLAGYGITDSLYFQDTNAEYAPARFFSEAMASKAANKYIEWWQRGAGWFNHLAGKYIVAGANSSQFLKGDGSLDSNAYLPLTGGVVDGTLMNPLTIKTSAAEVGIPMSVNNSAKMWVGWNSSYGAYIYSSASSKYLGIKDDGTPHFGNNTLIHSGNYDSYTYSQSTIDSKLSQYLPLSGGTISGALTLQNSIVVSSGADRKLVLNNTDTESKSQFISFMQENLEYGKLGTAGTDDLRWNNNIVLHSSNYSSYALPLSGGTINATGVAPLIINTSASDSSVVFRVNGNSKTQIGYSPTIGSFIYNYNSSKSIGIKDDGTPHFGNNTLIHSGNIGSYNAGSATKLQTARTIWGQSFDGTGNITGDLHLNQSDIYWCADKVNYCIESITYTDKSPSLKIAHYGGIAFHVVGEQKMLINTSGNVLIGTTTDNGAKLQVNGNLTVTGGGAFGSDIRYKDITSYRQLNLETIANAPLFSFRWTDREDKVEHLGTSAQYWLDTQFKDAVNTANKDFFHLDYGALAVGIGISVAREVKVVKTEVELLRDEVRQLKEKLNKYEQVWHN